MTGTLYEEEYIFMIIAHLILLGMRNVSDKLAEKNQNTFYVK
jgi:hypothetical protein